MRAPKDAQIVVVRCSVGNSKVATPRIAWLVRRTRVAIDVRLRMYGTTSYRPETRTLPADALARDATRRERTLGDVVDPLSPPRLVGLSAWLPEKLDGIDRTTGSSLLPALLKPAKVGAIAKEIDRAMKRIARAPRRRKAAR